MKFLNFICPLALIAATPALAQYPGEDYEYDLAVRDALAAKISWNAAFGDIRKGVLGNPDNVKNKKKSGDDTGKDSSDEDSSSVEADRDSNEKDDDKSKSKEKKKKNKDKRAVERALYIRDLMDEFLEERGLEDYDFDFE